MSLVCASYPSLWAVSYTHLDVYKRQAFTYNTVKSSSSVNDFTMLDYAEAADETTVVFHMTRPFSIWPYRCV